jgi:energy-coupling factor transport system substrate-specific component
MTWQLGAFGLLAAGLLAGFAWYEHSKPDARIVALVGTLAAFAALGRIAFAAVPNVKPTTDIVLISGFALGGAPGYVVGAVAALTSNFFFGQGPWTPWQMAGWGAVGVAGALLARLSGRRIGRLPLAIVCFVIGFLFTALQDFGDWITYSDHSLVQLGVYVGKGIGFDLVHAVGCFGFAMLFGPALLHALKRFTTRIQVTWLPPARATLPLLLAIAVVSTAVGGANPPRAAAATHRRSPIRYLLSAQNRDGGFGMAPGEASDTMVSGWVTLALMAGGVDPRGPEVGGRNVFDYLSRTLGSERGAGAIERTLLAASTVSDVELAKFGQLRAKLPKLVEADGSIGGQTNLTAFGILALRAARLNVPARTISWLARQQDRDGGFNFATRGGQSDVDDTGAVLCALAGVHQAAAARRAVAFIRGQQNRDGGFGDQQGAPSNAQSTAFAVSGLIAAGVSPEDVRRRGSPSPVAYLRSLIQPDGAVDYARGNAQTPVWVTAEAEIALSGHAL